jgi:hypothetical protein
MNEQYQDSVIEEVAPPETEHSDVSMHTEQDYQAQEAQRKADEQEKNWAAMRQRQKEMEMEIRQKNELLDRLLQQNQPKQAVQEIVEEEEPDDDYVPAGKVKGIARRTVQPLEKKIQELENKLAKQETEKRIQGFKTQYPDFDDVVNVETLEMLEKTEPELAATIAELKDPYKMGQMTYKLIKSTGILDKLPNARRSKEIAQKLERNEKTVQSPSAYDKRPMAQAFKSAAVDTTKLYEEMMFYASQAQGL